MTVVVVLTGSVAASHGHVSAIDGRPEVSHHGTAVHDDGMGSCSICKLAHETSSGPVTVGIISEPVFWVAPTAQDGLAFLVSVFPRSQQPRAPPCLVSC